MLVTERSRVVAFGQRLDSSDLRTLNGRYHFSNKEVTVLRANAKCTEITGEGGRVVGDATGHINYTRSLPSRISMRTGPRSGHQLSGSPTASWLRNISTRARFVPMSLMPSREEERT